MENLKLITSGSGTPLSKQKQKINGGSSNFTSYVNFSNKNGDAIKPKLLAGELQSASADVHLFPSTSKISDENEKDGIPGMLFVTNFKLTFVPYNIENEQGSYQDNVFLGKNDVTLNNIDIIYQIVDKKKKRVFPHQKISSRIEALHIVCKNFRLLKFSFKRTAKDKGKLIVAALARFAYPTRPDLSFAYEFTEKYYNTLKPTVTMYTSKNDWTREMIRCGTTEWKVFSAEQISSASHIRSHSLPSHFVIPKSYTTDKFLEFSSAFCDNRSAFWVFSYGPNASLIRMGELRPEYQDRTIENITLELVRKCDPNRKSLEILNLCDLLPSIQGVRKSYLKFRELCTPDSPRQFLLQDSKYWSLLDKSCWLLYSSLCLKYASNAAAYLRKGTTVVLQEESGRDMCCIISSLTQIILDPYFRTIDGFQSLIQKEWIALEHSFSDRLGHVWKNNGETSGGAEEESPLLLLFLDCTWQLLQQFPEEFEFSQTYLTTVWDSAFLPIFDTFQFNTEKERLYAANELKLTLRSLWDWNEQFAEKDKMFFTNPFYVKKQTEINRKSVALPPNAVLLPGFKKPTSSRTIPDASHQNTSTIPKDRYLTPRFGISDLSIWEQCYYRWVPILEIKNGGFPQIDLFYRLILSNISKLQRALETGEFDELHTENVNSKEEETVDDVDRDDKDSNEITPTNSPYRHLPIINSFFPFSLNTGDSSQLIDILTNSNELLTDGSIMERLSIAQLPD